MASYSFNHTIACYEADANKVMRPTAMLDLMQEAANVNASCSFLSILFQSTFHPQTLTCRFSYFSGCACASRSISALNTLKCMEAPPFFIYVSRTA